MRSFTRQSARLASTSRARHSTRPRTATTPVSRPFSAASPLASDPRPPHGSANQQTPISEVPDESKRHDNAPPKSEHEAETDNGEDQRRPGTKRQVRNKRLNDAPQPPPIPDWFLKHNVKLFKDSPGLGVSSENGQVVRCVDAETGHTLFEVPYYGAYLTSMAEKTGKDDNGKAALQRDFFDQSVEFEGNADKEEKKAEKKEGAEFQETAIESEDDWKRNPMRWVFLEAESSARAAFSLPPENQRTFSLLSNRVDLSLQCPDSKSHDQMDELVENLARMTQADLIRLDANDFSELTEEYVGMGTDGPGSYSNLGYDVFQGYAASSVPSSAASLSDHFEQDEQDEQDEEPDEDEREGISDSLSDILKSVKARAAAMMEERRSSIGIAIGTPPSTSSSGSAWPGLASRTPSRRSQESIRDETRMAALLDDLLDAPKHRQSWGNASKSERTKSSTPKNMDEEGRYQEFMRNYRSHPAFWLPGVAKSLVSYLSRAFQDVGETEPAVKLVSGAQRKDLLHSDQNATETRRTIIHVRELRDIANSRLGDVIIQQLCKVVQKRRRNGEQVMIAGTTSSDVLGPFHPPGDQTYMDEFPLRSITVPPFLNFTPEQAAFLDEGAPKTPSNNLDNPGYRRILEINVRHLQSMLRKLRPNDDIKLVAETRGQLNMPGMQILGDQVLSLEQVQRLALIAIGLSQQHARAEVVKPIHLALANFVASRSDITVKAWTKYNRWLGKEKIRNSRNSEARKGAAGLESSEARIDEIKKSCNAHETRLLTGVVISRNIKTRFDDVHAPPETIDALKTLTSLSLLRPEAFKYGVLANDRLPGLLLYGPPGTGKTLLAKAVAKESKATVLEVSGAQIYEKYVGEGEKMVRAVFTLAKKLSPCVVFIDEADAIFGSRSMSGGNRGSHREIINQFLREWDGMDDHGVFMMVASNRPFDLDDAVLRRLPRRLLVDLPAAKDRELILQIHLQRESLDSSVSFSKLAEQTPLYSGSDLKNLAVSAALSCVKEENELLKQHENDSDFKLPDVRTLSSRHFDKALSEISASISEDMSSLKAIRKFDEQYGDRKGKRKKTNYGFGLQVDEVDESAARVRSAPPPPPPA